MRTIATAFVISGMLIATGTLSGCQSTSTSEHAVTTIHALVGTWDLAALDGTPVADMLGPDMKAPNLEFAEDGRVSGFAGVNRVMSSVDLAALKRGDFALSPAATTMMAGPDQAMDLEQKFLSALQRATGVRLDGDRLELTDAGASVLSFVRGS